MDGLRQAHTDVLVAVPGQGLPDCACPKEGYKEGKLPKLEIHS